MIINLWISGLKNKIPYFSPVTTERGVLNVKSFIFSHVLKHWLQLQTGLVSIKLKAGMRGDHYLPVIFHLYYYLFSGIDFQLKRCTSVLGKLQDRTGVPGQICACFAPFVHDLIWMTCSRSRHLDLRWDSEGNPELRLHLHLVRV